MREGAHLQGGEQPGQARADGGDGDAVGRGGGAALAEQRAQRTLLARHKAAPVHGHDLQVHLRAGAKTGAESCAHAFQLPRLVLPGPPDRRTCV